MPKNECQNANDQKNANPLVHRLFFFQSISVIGVYLRQSASYFLVSRLRRKCTRAQRSSAETVEAKGGCRR